MVPATAGTNLKVGGVEDKFFHLLYGGLSEDAPHWLMYYNVDSLVDGIVLEGLRGMALLEEVYHWVIGLHQAQFVFALG